MWKKVIQELIVAYIWTMHIKPEVTYKVTTLSLFIIMFLSENHSGLFTYHTRIRTRALGELSYIIKILNILY